MHTPHDGSKLASQCSTDRYVLEVNRQGRLVRHRVPETRQGSEFKNGGARRDATLNYPGQERVGLALPSHKHLALSDPEDSC